MKYYPTLKINKGNNEKYEKVVDHMKSSMSTNNEAIVKVWSMLGEMK